MSGPLAEVTVISDVDARTATTTAIVLAKSRSVSAHTDTILLILSPLLEPQIEAGVESTREYLGIPLLSFDDCRPHRKGSWGTAFDPLLRLGKDHRGGVMTNLVMALSIQHLEKRP
jgi:hypothetical protein